MRNRANGSALAKGLQIGAVCACANLRRAARAVTQLYDEALRPTGLRVTQLTLLVAARRLEPVTVTRLAEATVMDRTTLTRDLKPLEREGFIRIEPGGDRRVREVTLTDQGRKALARALPLWEKAQSRVATGLGQARLRRLLSDLSATVALTWQR
ncbi:MAG: MarR family winged helix-turn-helix transcriptional regulator [Candidatus Methylomirabilia bacterium]